MTTFQTFDYIIVGAGSAGCVLANRLTEDPSVTVLLLENGGSDRSLFIQMPSALTIPMNSPKYDWQYESEPEPYLNNRRLHCPRGKVLGGSSSVNGMVYVRGHALDFDKWANLGAKDWDFRHCLPYFRKAEDWLFTSDAYRAQGGPLAVNVGNNMQNPLYRVFIKAGIEAGYPATDDYNGYMQEGFGPMQMTVKNGIRCSTANAYIKPAKHRKNLCIQTHCHVNRIVLEAKKAIGVEYCRHGNGHLARANREILVCAGSIGSPQLLQVSGIGPAAVLQQAGIRVEHNLPGVGENLQDHLEFYFQYRCHQKITLNGKLDPLSKALIGIQWLLFKNGLGATNHFEACAFIRSMAGVKWPDLQYHFVPAAIRYDGRAAFKGHGFQVHVGHNLPKSRGRVYALSADIRDKPSILFNYLQAEEDRQGFRDCVRLTRGIMQQPAMDPYRGSVIQPAEELTSDDEIDSFIRDSVESAYHPSCSCKMGTDDMAVVDPETKVHGLANLRVIDSSIFPSITNGNINAPTIMLAERAADIIKDKGLLDAVDVPIGIADNWQHSQRLKQPIRESHSA